ncbi:MAG: preprotein translocase subunit SecA [Candidatus Wildermuthbacteria bacterium GWA2_46_15]|uniref:Protein translocase subunit SecA n=1 Tax=Candidatus Wildermuthbacteria bacterium GWA2_46_15 TaxID=1802443 RepID=A0A1G2QRL4_9BACT|nr:MAG: preprotein translocase subunit SecA [Candidatus Wildermuthbacteria bacterium GWA2_46_15]
MNILEKVFGDPNEKYLKELRQIVEQINSREKEDEGFSSEKLKEKTQELRQRLAGGETLDQILPEAFALVREASKRTLGQRHFDVQLMGGLVLHQGKIAQMLTGEGKTLVATLPLYLNALEGQGCHLVTVNDYLAKRDMVWMGQIYEALGLSVGCITHEVSYLYDSEYKDEVDKERDVVGGFKVVESFLRPCSKKESYAADITYGTNNEFGFDYLRDNMVHDLKDKAQRDFNFAIVDEVDSILIDEARTPLIISAPEQEPSKMYQEFAQIIPHLKEKEDYEIDEKLRAVTLTEDGINKIEKLLGLQDIYQEWGIKYIHHLEQALKGETLFKKDRDYVVKNGEVVIVDEFTGRLLPGRRWSGGLHQAVEAKEGCQVQPESLTLATVTFQNYFRLYKKLAGMTGTAATSAEEFAKVYNLEVVMVPPNKPMIRQDLSDRVYKSEKGKFRALVREIKERHEKGQPVLVGTRSVEKNEFLGQLLEREGVPHQILNAKHHEQEGQIIAQAGKFKSVTIATNMAGRGVDIILGGNPPNPEEARRVVEAGGLHIVGTERHEARRIDDQLRGRAGRQGDPGSSQFFLCLEDDLLRVFGGETVQKLMEMLKIPDDQPIEAAMVSRTIADAQQKIEGFNLDARSHLLEYDNVINKHRETIYRKRREISEKSPGENLKEQVLDLLKKYGYSLEEYEKKEKEIGSESMRQVEKIVFLRVLDGLWVEHLENLESLQDAVRLRAYGQQDPLIEFKNEGHKMFQGLLTTIETEVARALDGIRPNNQMAARRENVVAARTGPKVGRNDPCPCGAKNPDGRPVKYKHCHGK